DGRGVEADAGGRQQPPESIAGVAIAPLVVPEGIVGVEGDEVETLGHGDRVGAGGGRPEVGFRVSGREQPERPRSASSTILTVAAAAVWESPPIWPTACPIPAVPSRRPGHQEAI